MKRILMTVLLVAGLAALPGCLFGSTSKVDYRGRHVTDDQMLRVQQGVSEADVLELLGEPSNRSDLGDATELWTWHFTRHTESSSTIFLLLASQSEVVEHGTVYVRFEDGRVAKVWRSES